MIADLQRWPSFVDNFRADFIGKGVQGVGTASVQYGAWSPAGIHTYGPSGAALRVARVGKSQLLTTVAVTRLFVALRVSLPGLQSRRGVKGSSKISGAWFGSESQVRFGLSVSANFQQQS